MYKSDKAAVLFRIEGEQMASAIACLGDANVSSTMDIDSRNCIGSSVPQKTATSMDRNMSFSGVADISEDGVQERLFKAYKNGKRIQVEIIYSEDPVDGYEGTVIISDWSVSLSAPGMAELSFTGQGASELFLIHESDIGAMVTIMNLSDELASGERVVTKVYPSNLAVTYSIDPTVSGVTIGTDGEVTFTGAINNGQEFTVKASGTSGSITATAKRTFKAVGQES